jgi:anthranilate phosphoribosyltransferase
MIVHGLDGVDEISLLGRTRIHDLDHGKINVFEIEPEDFGLARCQLGDIRSQMPKDNAALIRKVFDKKLFGAPRNVIVFNCAAALIVGGRAENFVQGIALASEVIDEGKALTKLNELIEMSNSFSATETLSISGQQTRAVN